MVFQVDGVMVKLVGGIETSELSLSVTTILTLAVGMVAKVTLMVAVVPNSLVFPLFAPKVIAAVSLSILEPVTVELVIVL